MHSRKENELTEKFGFMKDWAKDLQEDAKRLAEGDRLTGDKAPFLDPWELRMQHRFCREQDKQDRASKQFLPRTTVTKAYVSYQPLKSLKLTCYSDLRINIQAADHFLFVRTLEPVSVKIGIQTIAEDHKGSAMTLALYNYISPHLEIEPEDALPTGTILILKEPFLKTGAAGGFIIRCDSPSDVITVGRDSEYYEMAQKIKWSYKPSGMPVLWNFNGSAETWKLCGNEMFKKKKYNEAREAYSVALRKATGVNDDDLVKTLHLNLAAVFLSLEYFEKTLEECDKVLEKDPTNWKALFRAGRALYQLRNYSDALKYFDKLPNLDTQPDFKKEKDRCMARLEEAAKGVDIYKLYLSRTLKSSTYLDVADFTGPFKITEIAGKGRGVVATEDIKPRRLLLICKASQSAFASALERVSMQVNWDTKTWDHGGDMRLVSEIAQAVMKNPQTFGKQVYDLTSNDVFLDHGKRFCDETRRLEPIADVERLRKILTVNSFSMDLEALNSASGLFLTASYFNHSCVPNTSWQTYNDVLVIHAIKPIPKDAEITIAYVSSEKSYTERLDALKNKGFTCKCYLCQLDSSEPKSHLRSREKLISQEMELLKTFRAIENPPMPSAKVIAEHGKLVRAIEKSYESSGRSDLRIALFRPYASQMILAFRNEKREQALELVSKVLGSLGINLQHLLDCVRIGNLDILGEKSVIGSGFPLAMGAILNVKDRSYHQSMLAALELLELVVSGYGRHIVKKKYANLPELYSS